MHHSHVRAYVQYAYIVVYLGEVSMQQHLTTLSLSLSLHVSVL